MSLLIPGTNSIKETGYDVSNSLRFDDGSTNQLYRTTTAGSDYKATFSAWVKRTNPGAESFLLYGYYGSNDKHVLNFYQDQLYNNLIVGASTASTLVTNRLFRDVSAWYHIVVAWDTTQSTASDRIKMYVNGVQETSFSTSNYPNQNTQIQFNRNTNGTYVGGQAGSNNFDGYMSEVVFIDGSALDPTSFGEFDSVTSNVWVPKDISAAGLTFGTNGFYCEFKQSGTSQNSSGLGADTSGNDNHLAAQNLTSLAQSTDTCTNNGCILNSLASDTTPIFTNGNLTINGNGNNSSNEGCPATFVLSRGKWYWEMKNESSNHANYIIPGFMDAEFYANLVSASGLPGNYYDANNGFTNNVQGGGDNNNYSIHRAGSSNATSTGGLLQNQVLSFALDLDNRKCWFAREGTYYNSGDPAAGSNETWGTSDIVAGKSYTPVVFHYYTGSQGSFNFGSPAFSISSGNSDANGYGNFEYAVPSGFYAINSKNLAEFG
jgi:hypothetical protein